MKIEIQAVGAPRGFGIDEEGVLCCEACRGQVRMPDFETPWRCRCTMSRVSRKEGEGRTLVFEGYIGVQFYKMTVPS